MPFSPLPTPYPPLDYQPIPAEKRKVSLYSKSFREENHRGKEKSDERKEETWKKSDGIPFECGHCVDNDILGRATCFGSRWNDPVQFGEPIYYGDYLTTKMTFDGDNMAYCVEPLKKTPQAGTYSYNLLPTDSPVRKALYYLPGGYGYDANIKDQYLSGWSKDHAYVIGTPNRCLHLFRV